MNRILYILLLFILIVSCDPCDDCTSITYEPTVEMIFINADSLASIDSALVEFSRIDSALTANIDSLTVLRDSLQIVVDSIANGGNLISEKMNLESLISERQSDSTIYADQNVGLDALATVLNTTRSTINSGLMLIESITLPETSASLHYTDSAASWRVPLSYQKAFSVYELLIDGTTYTIELDYENFTEVDEQRNVLIRAQDIQVINHSFDSLNTCENCVDGEATITFYF